MTMGVVLDALIMVPESVPSLVGGKIKLEGLIEIAMVPAATETPVSGTVTGLLMALSEVKVSVPFTVPGAGAVNVTITTAEAPGASVAGGVVKVKAALLETAARLRMVSRVPRFETN